MRNATRWLRLAMRAIGMTAAIAASTPGAAATFPDRPVRLIVTQAAGGGPDIVARLVAERMARGLGETVIVENRAGGANVIGAQAAARAAPDGYTYLFATTALLATNPHTLKRLPYDAAKDFVPVGMVGKTPFLIVVNAAVPVQTLGELIALDQREPGKLSIATDGPRNFSGMIAAWLNKIAGSSIAPVPYAVNPQVVQDTLAGRTQVTILAPVVATPFVKRGELRALAQTGAQRMLGYETIPTVADTYPGFDFVGWFAIVAPTGTPNAAILRMNQELDRALQDPAVAQRLRTLGFVVGRAESPAATGEFIRAERERWARVVREIGLEPE